MAKVEGFSMQKEMYFEKTAQKPIFGALKDYLKILFIQSYSMNKQCLYLSKL